MPIYEYRSQSCGKGTSHFLRSISVVSQPQWPECGTKDMSRLISKVLHLKPEAERISGIDTSRALGGLDGNDAASFARWARRTGCDLDSALGTNFRALAGQAASGADLIEVGPGHSLRYAVEKKLSEGIASGGGDV